MDVLGGLIIDARTLNASQRARLYRMRDQRKLVILAPGRFMLMSDYNRLNERQQETAKSIALASTRPSSALSGRSAAHLLGLPYQFRRRPRTELAYPHKRPPTREDITARTLGPHARLMQIKTDYGHVNVTDYPTTCIDLARWYGEVTGVQAMDYAIRNRKCSKNELLERAALLNRTTGAARARVAAKIANAASESPRESLIKAGLYLRGYRNVWQQVNIEGVREGFIARVDFYLPSSGVVVEYDGAGKYAADPGKDRREYRQTVELQSLGLIVIRVRAEHVQDGRVWELLAKHRHAAPAALEWYGGVRAF
ncbi:hypothetical protein QP027_07675 [Corynebacterium breve]|uniref:DUF559 domain-containing protein n=1 Tax=Corynebacterium breve TaxID=3049799 RepID=A0ABY8VBJ8_9CORY|nr:hypothetical protein [Corynebacterium breve]WIM67006.1 hypothetical protein QP027_07675 [Corynebacterium breve]